MDVLLEDLVIVSLGLKTEVPSGASQTALSAESTMLITDPTLVISSEAKTAS